MRRFPLFLSPDPPGGSGYPPPAHPPAYPPKTPPDHVPVSALQAEREKRQALEARLAKIEADQVAADRAAAEKRGEFEALYTETKGALEAAEKELADFRDRARARRQALEASNKERLSALPEDLQPLMVPGLDPAAAADQLTKLEALAEKTATRPAGGRRGGGTPPAPDPIPADCIREAAAAGEDPQWWFDHVWNRPKRRAYRERTGAP